MLRSETTVKRRNVRAIYCRSDLDRFSGNSLKYRVTRCENIAAAGRGKVVVGARRAFRFDSSQQRRLHSIMTGYYDGCNAVSATLCANTFSALWRPDLKTAPGTVSLPRPRRIGPGPTWTTAARLRKILDSPHSVRAPMCSQYATGIGIIFGNRWHAPPCTVPAAI